MLPPMSHFYTSDFFSLVDELGLWHFATCSNSASRKKEPVYGYTPNVFLNTSLKSKLRYMHWVTDFVNIFHQLLEYHQQTLKQETREKVLKRAHLLFSGYLGDNRNYVFFPLLTPHHIEWFITLAKNNARRF